MNKCFVMQPFDGDKFDKRYDDVIVPAISKAGLVPYRVDRDPSASIPIDVIEEEILNSQICLAEITTDNPNVWFELGFAIAAKKEVVLICSEERESKFPFDIQHRNIIRYKVGAPQDYKWLQNQITSHMKAMLNKQHEIAKISTSPLKETKGLSQHEKVCLVTVMQNSFLNEGLASAYLIKTDMNKVGFTDLAVSLALRQLTQKGMISSETDHDEYGNTYSAYSMKTVGEEWLIQNQDDLVLKQEPVEKDDDDGLPF